MTVADHVRSHVLELRAYGEEMLRKARHLAARTSKYVSPEMRLRPIGRQRAATIRETMSEARWAFTAAARMSRVNEKLDRQQAVPFDEAALLQLRRLLRRSAVPAELELSA